MKAILVDDETLALDFLERQLKKISNIEVIGKFNNLDVKKDSSLLEEADVLFLDIEMPEMNGLELAEKLIEINPNLFIVFVTAFNDYAVEAFELNALDYVLKPVQVDRLKKTLERITSLQKDTPLIVGHKLKVNVCRELTFELSKDRYEVVNWRTTKAQELFLYLLHHREKTIRKYSLVEMLWPDFDQDKAYSQLYTAIYHIRKSLNKFTDYFSIKNMQDGYILFTKNIVIDVVEWEHKILSAPSINIETISDYEARMEAYTGSYLQEYDYLWAENERYRLEQLWINTAYQMANCYYKHNDFDNAEKWYKKICELRPEEENAHFSLMKLYANFGYGMLVNHQYLQLEKGLEELSIDISPNILNWYNEWRKN